MNNRNDIILFATIFLAVLTFGGFSPPALFPLKAASWIAPASAQDEENDDEDDDDDDDDVQRVVLIDGVPAVRLSAETQVQSGVEVEALERTQYIPVFSTFGRVIDIQPLLMLRARYGEVKTRIQIAQAALAAAKKDVDRLGKLHKDIPAKALQQAEATRKTHLAQLRGAEMALRSIRGEALQGWGPALTKIALSDNADTLKSFYAGEEVLLLVTLPPASALPLETSEALLFRTGDEDDPIPAALVSPARETDPVVQGETYYFRAPAFRLRLGMRVDVQLSDGKPVTAGVLIPRETVVWYAGKPWVYVQIDDDLFLRRAVVTQRETPEGWFVVEGFAPGDHLVVTGAQMLLSEEFRWQIQGDDDD